MHDFIVRIALPSLPQMTLIPRIIQSFISHKVLRCVKLMFGLSFLRRFGGVRFICVRGWGYRVWPVLHWKPDQAKAHTAIAAWRSPACATCVRNGATHPFENDARHEPHLPDIATPAVPNAPLNRLRLPRATENQRNVVPQKWVEARKNKWLAEKCRSLKTDDALRRQFANIGKCSMDV